VLFGGADYGVYPVGPCDGGYPDGALNMLNENGLTDCDTNSQCGTGCHAYVCGSGSCSPNDAYMPNICENGGTGHLYTAPSQAYWISGVSNVQTEVMANGPVISMLDVYDSFFDFFANNPTGVYDDCSGNYDGGHAVVLVGWGTDDGGLYWLLQNQWDTSWGDNGFFRMRANINICNMEAYGWWGIIPSTSKRVVNNDTITVTKRNSRSAVKVPTGRAVGMDVAHDDHLNLVEQAARNHGSSPVSRFHKGTVQVVNGVKYQVSYSTSDGSLIHSNIHRSPDGRQTFSSTTMPSSPATTSAPATTKDDGGYSGGAVAGIAIGTAVGGAILGALAVGLIGTAIALIMFAVQKKKSNATNNYTTLVEERL